MSVITKTREKWCQWLERDFGAAIALDYVAPHLGGDQDPVTKEPTLSGQAAKICTSCRKTLDVSAFHRCSSNPDGLQRSCKGCLKARRSNRWEKEQATRRKWKADNPEKVKAGRKRTFERNPEKHRERCRKWRAENPLKQKAATQAWKANHPEAVLHLNAKRNALLKAAVGGFTGKEWWARCEEYDHRCAYCRESLALTQHHVVPLSRGGTNLIENIVPACQSCNSRVGTKIVYPEVSIHEKRGVIAPDVTPPEGDEGTRVKTASAAPASITKLAAHPTTRLAEAVEGLVKAVEAQTEAVKSFKESQEK